MDKYRELAEKATAGKKEMMPRHNGTVSQYQKRFEIFSELIQEASKILQDLGNQFIQEHDCNLEEIENINAINKSIIESYIAHFKSNK
jgi:hypothetical protein